MGIKINKTFTTPEGFDVDSPFGYLDISLNANPVVRMWYFKSLTDWENGKQPIQIDCPPIINLNSLSNEVFWSAELIDQVHQAVRSILNESFGSDIVEIVK